jgi:fructokinase
MIDVLVIGEAFVDFLPANSGSIRDMSAFEMHSGGAPCNVALGCARLGAKSALISVVGDDDFGGFILKRLEEEGVDSTSVRRLNGGITQLCFVTLDEKGERSFTGRGPDASLELSPQDIDLLKLAQAKVLVLTCGSLRKKNGIYAVQEALNHAKNWIVCDPGTCPPHWCEPTEMRKRLDPIFQKCHFIKCADHESYWLTGENDPEIAVRKLVDTFHLKGAIITCGANGAIWATQDNDGVIPTPFVEVVDTTGAGDAFMSAFCAELSKIDFTENDSENFDERSFQKIITYANHIASLSVTKKGAVHGIPKHSSMSEKQPE